MANRLAQYQNQVNEGFGYEDFAPIPQGTEVVCLIEGIAWERLMNTRVRPPQEDEFIKVRYRVIEGDYENRVIFQKLFILGKVEQNAEKNAVTEENALLMLAALDCLVNNGALAKLSHDPEDEDLVKLENKKVLVKVGINRFKDSFGEMRATNSVRQLSAAPAVGSASRSREERRPRDTSETSERAPRERRERRPR